MQLYQHYHHKPTVPQQIPNLIAQSQWEEQSIYNRWWLMCFYGAWGRFSSGSSSHCKYSRHLSHCGWPQCTGHLWIFLRAVKMLLKMSFICMHRYRISLQVDKCKSKAHLLLNWMWKHRYAWKYCKQRSSLSLSSLVLPFQPTSIYQVTRDYDKYPADLRVTGWEDTFNLYFRKSAHVVRFSYLAWPI